MTGFAGFFASPDPLPDAAPLLARLGRALSSSPPDADPTDTLTLAEGRAGFTGTRLERSGDGTLALAFDGTLFNRPELTAVTDTPPQRAMSDGELVLALYARHGMACVDLLRGPFALALWDGREETCLLARDPMGLRTLYYFQEETPGGTLLFATGVRPLAASGVVPRKLDARGLYGLFRHGAVPEPWSMVAGVRALETGGRLSCRAGNVITHTRLRSLRRTAPARPDAGLEEGETAATALRAALLDSVDRHLADGAPTAVFVGGGMGSAALLALAREAGREKNLRALTLGFDDAFLDETEAARRAAREFGVPLTPLRLDRTRARAWFDDFLSALDQPGVHGFGWFALCRFAREEGVNVALAGVGAGEWFGNVRFHWQMSQLLRVSQRLGRGRAPLSRLIGAVAGSADWQRRADFLTRPPTPAGAYAALCGIHTAAEARALVARFTDPTGCAEPTPEDADTFPTLDDEINALELRRCLRDQLLRDANTFSRACGLELRLPFVDARITETLMQIPASVRLRGEHWCLLRQAVPEATRWENATGSGSGLRFPAKTWRAAEWGMAKPADAAGVRRSRRTWEQKWSLFLFRRWWRQVNTA